MIPGLRISTQRRKEGKNRINSQDIGAQEKAFRKDPVSATSDIVKKVFGAIAR